MEKKINLEEILLKSNFTALDILKTIISPDGQEGTMYDRLMNGIKEVCKQTLELAAENAETIEAHNMSLCESCGGQEVDKQSILDTINQVE